MMSPQEQTHLNSLYIRSSLKLWVVGVNKLDLIVFILLVFGKDKKDIANRLGVTVSRVEQRYKKARKSLLKNANSLGINSSIDVAELEA